jgi:nucleoside-diphosphate-sugar epimerase
MKLHVIGDQSGLGKFLVKKHDDIWNIHKSILHEEDPDAIVYCARKRNVKDRHEEIKYNVHPLEDHLVYSKVYDIKFIYISSIDVYPKIHNKNTEEDQATMFDEVNSYANCKLTCEDLIKSYLDNYVIIRPCAFLGQEMKPNSVTRILFDDPCNLNIDRYSHFTVITYEEVLKLILAAHEHDLRGVYNLAPETGLFLFDIEEKYRSIKKSKVIYGPEQYIAPQVSLDKTVEFVPELREPASYFIEKFLEQGRIEDDR